MEKLLFATGNEAKVNRFKERLRKEKIELLSLKDIDVKIDVEENGKNAAENAYIKAKAYYDLTGIPTIAMDDNLFLDNVPEKFQPGVFVRRVNGKRLDDSQMISHYSGLAKKYGENGKLRARWAYAICLIKDGKENIYTYNNDDFYIVDKPSKVITKGYPLDSVSKGLDLKCYFSEVTKKEDIKDTDSGAVKFIVENLKRDL